MTHLPDLSPALVEALERAFPDRCPPLGLPDREVWFRAGQADVVRKMREALSEQSTDGGALPRVLNVHSEQA